MISLRYIKKNKKQTLATILSIILAGTLLFTVGILFSSFRGYLIDKVLEKANYHVRITGDLKDYKKNIKSIKFKNNEYEIIYKNINKTYENTKEMCKIKNCEVITYNTELLSLYGLSENETMKTFKELIIFLVFIFSLASFFIIHNVFEISIYKRKKDIALLKCANLTNKDIYKIFFKESLIIGLIGITFSFIISLILDNIIINIINKLLLESLGGKLKLSLYKNFIFIPFIFLSVVIMLSSLIPLFKIKNYKIINLLHEKNRR